MAAIETTAAAAAVPLAPARTLRAHNWPLIIGLGLFGLLLLVGLIGPYFLDASTLEPGSVGFSEKPSLAHPLGTDGSGRDLLTFMVHGIIPTLVIGFIAGTIGTAIGSFVGLASGYFRGPADTFVRTLADIMLTIPSLIILIVIASFVRTTTIDLMALIIAIFAWPFPSRTIRSQTLSMRELAFVKLAKLSGRGDLSIIVRDLLPNLLPFIGAGFVGSVSGAVLASVGLQLLGLGPLTTPTIGLVLEERLRIRSRRPGPLVVVGTADDHADHAVHRSVPDQRGDGSLRQSSPTPKGGLMDGPLLRVENLHVSYLTERGPLRAVSAVSFSIAAGERFGIVGESGCGKSTTAMAILRLLKSPARVDAGRVLLNGVNLLALGEEDMRRRRWRDVSLVMQGAMNSLNPVTRVRKQLADVITTHEGKASNATLDRRIAELLRTVGLREQAADRFPARSRGT